MVASWAEGLKKGGEHDDWEGIPLLGLKVLTFVPIRGSSYISGADVGDCPKILPTN